MKKELQLRLLPEIAGNQENLKKYISRQEKLPLNDITHIEITRRSIDARQKQTLVNLSVSVYINEIFHKQAVAAPSLQNVKHAPQVIIIGAGPAGLFAALQLLQDGFKPVILERGKNVKERMADIRNINVRHQVNEDSNYCFGEGGAGAYSDGKLYTRSKKRGIR